MIETFVSVLRRFLFLLTFVLMSLFFYLKEQYDFMYQCLVDFVQQRTSNNVNTVYLGSPGDLNDIELRMGSNI